MSSHCPAQMSLFEEPTSTATRTPIQNHSAHPHSTILLRLCVLGSGSSGNCAVVSLGDSAVLIDAGFGPRATAKRLQNTGLTLGDVKAICLTHADRDHFNPTWLATLVRQRINVYVHSRHIYSLYRIDGARQLHRAGLLHTIDNRSFEPIVGLRAHTVSLPHDSTGTEGYLLEADGGRIGYATDLGRVPDEMISRFVGVDLLAIESNYDPQMQRASGRPAMLKRRITGGHGHLSNEQAFEAVCRIVDRCPRGGPAHVVLLHLSRQCNDPSLVRQLFARDSRLVDRLRLVKQHEWTGWLTVGAA